MSHKRNSLASCISQAPSSRGTGRDDAGFRHSAVSGFGLEHWEIAQSSGTGDVERLPFCSTGRRGSVLPPQLGRPAMPLFRQLPDRVRLTLWFTAIGAVIGAAYAHFISMQNGALLFGLAGVTRGVLTGAVMASVVGTIETLIATQAWAAPLRNASLAVHLTIKTLILLAVILFGLVLGAWLFPTPGEVGLWLPFQWADVAFSLAASFVFNFLIEVNRMLGRNVLLNFITGRYHQPRLEERVFLFIDMVGSTGIAERIGEHAFLRLLNRFVGDLTAPIVAARGEIHRYVGDELIATWKLSDGVAEARCVRACFGALDRLEREAPAYRRDFGAVLSFRAGLHCGPVVTGEMGTVKKEIVFLGDTVNTTALGTHGFDPGGVLSELPYWQ
jgi:adenylate cyclase